MSFHHLLFSVTKRTSNNFDYTTSLNSHNIREDLRVMACQIMYLVNAFYDHPTLSIIKVQTKVKMATKDYAPKFRHKRKE